MNTESTTLDKTFSTLRRFAQRRDDANPHCELCGADLELEHANLADVIRAGWRELSDGAEIWRNIRAFF